jgi:nitric oxide dioxygenase
MTTDQKSYITATVPVLRANGVLLTKHFYERMFIHNPELKNVFNMGNQKSDKQQTALALAVLAYAENIANPAVLLPALDRIGHKHVSLDIRPEHYITVGRHLVASIQEVMGTAATPEIIDAWTVAIQELAGLMSGYEANLYARKTHAAHGWTGWRPFQVKKKIAESEEISSFYLYPSDGGQVLKHRPGQYISIRTFLPQLNLQQSRQYSISSGPNENYYRISVKRETGKEIDTNGMISNHLHDVINENDIVELTAPSGNFTLPDDLDAPVTLISGGVGLTPLISMLQELVDTKHPHPISWLHGCRGEHVHAFKDHVDNLADAHQDVSQHLFYSQTTDQHIAAGIREGYLDIRSIPELDLNPDAHYFICGPSLFITKQYKDLVSVGIRKDRIYFEEFGPQVLTME